MPGSSILLTIERMVRPNVRAEKTAEAGADWPREDNYSDSLERLGGACRSGSARTRGLASLRQLHDRDQLGVDYLFGDLNPAEAAIQRLLIRRVQEESGNATGESVGG